MSITLFGADPGFLKKKSFWLGAYFEGKKLRRGLGLPRKILKWNTVRTRIPEIWQSLQLNKENVSWNPISLWSVTTLNFGRPIIQGDRGTTARKTFDPTKIIRTKTTTGLHVLKYFVPWQNSPHQPLEGLTPLLNLSIPCLPVRLDLRIWLTSLTVITYCSKRHKDEGVRSSPNKILKLKIGRCESCQMWIFAFGNEGKYSNYFSSFHGNC